MGIKESGVCGRSGGGGAKGGRELHSSNHEYMPGGKGGGGGKLHETTGGCSSCGARGKTGVEDYIQSTTVQSGVEGEAG